MASGKTIGMTNLASNISTAMTTPGHSRSGLCRVGWSVCALTLSGFLMISFSFLTLSNPSYYFEIQIHVSYLSLLRNAEAQVRPAQLTKAFRLLYRFCLQRMIADLLQRAQLCSCKLNHRR